MWLINTITLKLKFFTPPRVPSYAILSHTWGDEEVSFQEFQDLDKAMLKAGFAKIQKTCQLARNSGIRYAWVDTCCIDKSSSAELSESINSMYSWYRRSTICYAFLNDWGPDMGWDDLTELSGGHGLPDYGGWARDDYPEIDSIDENSPTASRSMSDGSAFQLRWFARGWTLQELIAPTDMEFYDQEWNLKGSKSDPRVLENLARITIIDPKILKDGSESNLRTICLGQRMSWAAYRHTSRTEDVAYCLMGIFQVNMPMIYGEGDRAFLRLQEEIIKTSTDLSIFALTPSHDGFRRGLFGYEFALLRDCCPLKPSLVQSEEFAMTNKGLRITATLFPIRRRFNAIFYNEGYWCIYLNCETAQGPQYITLQRFGDVYRCVAIHQAVMSEMDFLNHGTPRTIYIARDWGRDAREKDRAAMFNGWPLTFEGTGLYQFIVAETCPSTFYDGYLISGENPQRTFGFLKVQVFGKYHIPQEVPEFYLVCYGDSGLSIGILNADKADLFIKTLQVMNPITAREDYFAFFQKAVQSGVAEIPVPDTSKNVLLRIRAVTRDQVWGDKEGGFFIKMDTQELDVD